MRGFSFSWKRALGITAAKQKFARATGIPTSKAGLERKIGKSVLGSFSTAVVTTAVVAGLSRSGSKKERLSSKKGKNTSETEFDSDVDSTSLVESEVENIEIPEDVESIFAEMQTKVDEITELKNKIAEFRATTKNADDAKDDIKEPLADAQKLKKEVSQMFRDVAKKVGDSSDKGLKSALSKAEKLDKAAESGLDKVKKEYDSVRAMLTKLEAKEKKEKEKRNKTILKFLKDLILWIFKGSKKR